MRSKPRVRCSIIENQSINEDVDSVGSINAWVCLQFVLGLSPVGDFVWSGLRIWVLFFFFFFFSLLWTGGGGGCVVLGVGCYV